MQRRMILAATALAAALAVPAAASATDKTAGPGDKFGWQSKDQIGGSPSQDQAVGQMGSRDAAVGQMGGSTQHAVGQIGDSTPTQQAVGTDRRLDAGGRGPRADGAGGIVLRAGERQTSKGLPDATSAKLSKDAGDKLSSQLPTLEDKLRKQQDELDRLTDLLKQMQKTRDDVARAIAGS